MSKPEILQAEVTEMPEIEVEERENVEVPPASSVDFSTEQVEQIPTSPNLLKTDIQWLETNRSLHYARDSRQALSLR